VVVTLDHLQPGTSAPQGRWSTRARMAVLAVAAPLALGVVVTSQLDDAAASEHRGPEPVSHRSGPARPARAVGTDGCHHIQLRRSSWQPVCTGPAR
jgi:hypothetical protein